MTQHTRNFSFKVLTINTHKGFTAFNKRFILPELRDAVRTVGADIVCLQEVMGAHEVHPLHIENWPDTTHYEFLADTMWSDFAYGRNAVYPEGHHGNAVLSRYPIEHYENRDVSVGGSEKRGVLYCRITPPMLNRPIHVMCVHLGLRESHRQAQLTMLAGWVNALPESEPVLVAGDFNDWRQKGRPAVKRGRAGGDIHPCPWPTGAHIPGEYAAAATRSYLRQECERQFSYGTTAAELATFIRPCPP